MKYILMCGGKYNSWTMPRQMIKIRGEPVVARTIRLLQECGVEDIAISSNDKRFDQFGVHRLQFRNDFAVNGKAVSGAWVEAFYKTRYPACYIMGDVVFSPEAIRKIVGTETDGIAFFASSPPFPREGYIKPHAEPFAFKVADQKRFRAAINYIIANVDTGIFSRHPIAWELWQVINGWSVKDIEYGSYTAINDYTCDIDREEDAKRIEEVLP